jgi:hypothetical protein
MPNQPGRRHYRRYPIKPLALGLNDALNPALLQDGQTPDCENVDFDRESVSGSGGAVKFNNQPAPHSGVLTTVSEAPLGGVPSRGYVFVPYRREQDLGGDFALSGTALNTSTHEFHGRRGKSFTFSIGFRLPIDEKLYAPQAGSGAPASASSEINTYDEGLEECSLLAQKGGDAFSPMSWALGIVNTGDQFETITGAAAFDRPSNYALVFMWYDAPGWGAYGGNQMRYLVGAGGANVGSSGRQATIGLRAIIAKAFIEPGRDYQVAVRLRLDTGTPGDATSSNPTAAWNSDGAFEIVLRDQAGTVTRCATSGTDLFSWKGPIDNFDYLTRYGVRFSGRDPMFLGLGMRFEPWADQGFAPLGLDSARLASGGHRMIDVSASGPPAAYPAGQTCNYTIGVAHLSINLQGMHGNAANAAANLPNPYDPLDLATAAGPWPGLFNAGTGAIPDQGTAGQSEALRNCWVALWNGGGATPTAIRGGRVRIGHYAEGGGTNRLVRADGLVAGTGWATNAPFFVIVFRWRQRPLALSSFRIWTTARDLTTARARFSLASYSLPDDLTEPDISSLVGEWPMDDAGGGVLRDRVAGNDAYLAPYTLGRGSGKLFLSGEGEALTLDMEEDSVLRRELAEMLRSGSSGFAIEFSCVIPQAYYGREVLVGATQRRTQGAPVLASWEIRDDTPALRVAARPMLRLSNASAVPFAAASHPFFFPQGFTLEVDTQPDNETGSLAVAVEPWSTGPVANFSTTAEWVGERIRIQIGVQSTGNPDEYRVYMAASPKSVLAPAAGDPPNAEFAYFSTLTISRRALLRSVVVIGGAWRPESLRVGEFNARMIVEDVRVFGVAAPGALPAASGGVTPAGTGKLSGARALPPGKLSRADLLNPLNAAASGVNVTRESASVASAGGVPFFASEPEDTLDAAKETFVRVSRDELEVRQEDTAPVVLNEFYYAPSVSGSTLTLSRPFDGPTMRNVSAASFRVIGYTAFDDDISHITVQTSMGAPFAAGTNVPSDAGITRYVFANLSPCAAEWTIRTLSPAVFALDAAPRWWRAPSVPRRNPVLGMRSHRGQLFAATRGALYLADDRWRTDGPTETIKRSLHLRGRMLEGSGACAPLESDGVRFDSATGLEVTGARLGTGFSIDAWVKLDALADVQTILWVGSLSTNPMRNASGSAGQHKVHLWIRLANGAPELAIGSTATFDGTNRPAGGLFVARGAATLKVGEWTHVRFALAGAQSNTWISSSVGCFVNGRSVGVRLLATENAAPSDSWVQLSGMVPIAGCSALLGVARDAYSDPETARPFVDTVAGGVVFRPNRFHGRLHALGGLLARVAARTGAATAGFQPEALADASPTFLALAAPEGIGHKTLDSGGAQYGVIESHPAISLFHEMGLHENPASWALYGAALFVTTGGRPVHVRG